MHFPLSFCKNAPLLFPWCSCSIVYMEYVDALALPMCVTMPNLVVSALKSVGINKGEPHKLGNAGTPLSWDGATGPRKKFHGVFSHLDSINERDGRTDGQTNRHWSREKTALTIANSPINQKHSETAKFNVC